MCLENAPKFAELYRRTVELANESINVDTRSG